MSNPFENFPFSNDPDRLCSFFPASHGFASSAGGFDPGFFPNIEGTSTSINDTAGTSHTVDLPTGIVPGELLIICFSVDQDPSVTFPAGWAADFGDQNGTLVTLETASRIADGTEGASITVTTDLSVKSAHSVYRISGALDIALNPIDNGAKAFATDAAPNPGLITPKLGAALDWLYIAATAMNGNTTATAAPTGYTDLLSIAATGATGAGVGSSVRKLSAATEDPGTFTASASTDWVAITLVVQPNTAFVGATDQSPSSADLTVYTLSMGLGVEHETRKIVMATMSEGTIAPRTVSSMTIAGVSANFIVGQTNGNHRLEFWEADLPLGTFDDAVVTWSGACLRCAVITYAVYNVVDVINDTASSIADPMVASLNISSHGVGLGAMAGTLTPDTAVWTNLIRDSDIPVETTDAILAAFGHFGPEQVGLSITGDPDDTTPVEQAMILASFDNAIVQMQKALSNRSTGTTVTATFGRTPAQNNLIVACLVSSSSTFTAPTGWTEAVSVTTAQANTAIFYKVAGASEATAVTVTGLVADVAVLSILEYRGVVSASPLDQTSSGVAITNVSSIGTTATLETLQLNELAIAVVGFEKDAGTSTSWSDSFIEQEISMDPVGGPTEVSLGVSHKMIGPAGQKPKTTWTIGGTASKGSGSIATFKGK